MNQEFEDMRQQMNILKEKLQKQSIVNERIFQRSMRHNVSGINRRYTIVAVLCVLMIPYSYWAFVTLADMSIYFWLATAVLMVITFCATLYNGRHINSNLLNCNLVEARTRVAKAKKLDRDWLKFGIPAIVLWLGYFCYEQYRINPDGDWKILVAVCLISATIGGAIGMKIHFRNQEEYRQILEEIDDFTKEE